MSTQATLDSKAPGGDLSGKWAQHRFDLKLVNPSNRRKFKVLVVGTGLAGSSAAATLAEMGYQVDAFCIQDSPRRAKGTPWATHWSMIWTETSARRCTLASRLR